MVDTAPDTRSRRIRVAGTRTAGRVRSWRMRIFVVAAILLIAWISPGQAHDGIFDWLTAHEALNGDPYRPLHEIALDHGLVPAYEWLSPHPRLPGALLLQVPLVLVPFEWLPFVLRTVVGLSLASVALFVRPSWLWLLFAVPAFHAFWYGQTSAVVTLLVAVAVSRMVGWPVGVAATMRMWPWFLGLAFLVVGRWRAALASAAVFFGLNLAGLALPGVTWEGTRGLFVEASTRYATNPSNLMAFVPWWVGVGVAGLILWRIRVRPVLFPFAVVAALLASPVVWMHYLTVLAVAIGKAPRSSRRRTEGLR